MDSLSSQLLAEQHKANLAHAEIEKLKIDIEYLKKDEKRQVDSANQCREDAERHRKAAIEEQQKATQLGTSLIAEREEVKKEIVLQLKNEHLDANERRQLNDALKECQTSIDGINTLLQSMIQSDHQGRQERQQYQMHTS